MLQNVQSLGKSVITSHQQTDQWFITLSCGCTIGFGVAGLINVKHQVQTEESMLWSGPESFSGGVQASRWNNISDSMRQISARSQEALDLIKKIFFKTKYLGTTF